MHIKIALPQVAWLRIFFKGKSVVLHLHEGPELRMLYWYDREEKKPAQPPLSRHVLLLCYNCCPNGWKSWLMSINSWVSPLLPPIFFMRTCCCWYSLDHCSLRQNWKTEIFLAVLNMENCHLGGRRGGNRRQATSFAGFYTWLIWQSANSYPSITRAHGFWLCLISKSGIGGGKVVRATVSLPRSP